LETLKLSTNKNAEISQAYIEFIEEIQEYSKMKEEDAPENMEYLRVKDLRVFMDEQELKDSFGGADFSNLQKQ